MDRILWHPITAGLMVAWFTFRNIHSGATTFRVIALVWGCVWLGLAIYNHLSGGRYLRWVDRLGEDDDEDPQAGDTPT